MLSKLHMKAIILSAGQGSRLLPMTRETPKCLLPVADGITTIGWQLTQLAAAGVSEVTVVTGFHAEKVEAELARHSMLTRTVFNPFYKVADNLGSVWLARDALQADTLLINGDTLFTASVPRRVAAQERADITVTVSRKGSYDDDDMKVVEHDGRLLEIGKTLRRAEVNAESIGMILFRKRGAALFRAAVEDAMRDQAALGHYYLSVIGRLASMEPIGVAEAGQGEWCETDFPEDLDRARLAVARWRDTQPVSVAA